MADRCLVCGSVIGEGASLTISHDGETFNLCSEDCRQVFETYPEVYSGEQDTELNFIEDSAPEAE